MRKIKKILNFKSHWPVIGWSMIFVAALTNLIDLGLNGLGLIKIILIMMTIHALGLIIVTVWSQYRLERLPLPAKENYARYLFNLLNVFLADLEMIVLLPTIAIIKSMSTKVTFENIILSSLFLSLIPLIMKLSIYLVKMSNLFKLLPIKKTISPVVLQFYTICSYFLIFHLFYILN